MNNAKLIPLNKDHQTFLRTFDQATSNIDLTFISDQYTIDFTWNTLEHLNRSDRYSILFSADHPSPPQYEDRWNLEKADWNKFKDLAITRRTVETTESNKEAYEYSRHNTECIHNKNQN